MEPTTTTTQPSALAAAIRHRLALKDARGYVRVGRRIAEAITTLAEGVSAGIVSPDEFQAEMAELLLAGHLASYAAGRNVAPADLSPAEEARVARIVAGQLPYLDAFADQIDADGWRDQMEARAQMYGRAMRQSYESGRTGGLDLPAQPGDGSTECLSNCRCTWRIRWIDRRAGDADCTWVLSQGESCETCRERARRWRPLRVRGWEVQR